MTEWLVTDGRTTSGNIRHSYNTCNEYKKRINICWKETKVWEHISWQIQASEKQQAEWQDSTMCNG